VCCIKVSDFFTVKKNTFVELILRSHLSHGSYASLPRINTQETNSPVTGKGNFCHFY
jgi:hypothetical protein